MLKKRKCDKFQHFEASIRFHFVTVSKCQDKCQETKHSQGTKSKILHCKGFVDSKLNDIDTLHIRLKKEKHYYEAL